MQNIRTLSAFIREIPTNVDESRTVEFIISDATRDRHNTVVNPRGWSLENYNKNPIVAYNHNIYGGLFAPANPDSIIGKSVVSIEGEKVIGRVTFEPKEINELAEKIFQKVKFGTLRSASVGFAEIGKGKFGDSEEERKGGANETYYFKGQELYEWSIVNIPSNPSAVKRSDYKQPTIADILNKYSELSKEFSEEEIKLVGIIDLLKSMEGMNELKLSPKKIERNLLKAAELKLRMLNL